MSASCKALIWAAGSGSFSLKRRRRCTVELELRDSDPSGDVLLAGSFPFDTFLGGDLTGVSPVAGFKLASAVLATSLPFLEAALAAVYLAWVPVNFVATSSSVASKQAKAKG